MSDVVEKLPCWARQERTYIVAELSANHGGSLDRALETVEAIRESGADAVKLQTYTADTLTIDCDREDFRVSGGTAWDGSTLYELYREAHTPWQWHAELFRCATDHGLDVFSSPFDASAVDFLEQFDPPAYKIASFELIDTPLIEYVAAQGRPIILSTGMATLAEISTSVEIIRKAAVPLALLKCTSAYPSPPDAMNLRAIADLAERFDVSVGLSDHTLGIAVPIAAVALGATIIEKHFTLSRGDGGADSGFSLEPHEFKDMVDGIRTTEKAMGKVSYSLTEQEQASKAFRRSLYIVEDVAQGDALTAQNVRSIRPAYGMSPDRLPSIIGCRAAMDLERGTPLADSHITVGSANEACDRLRSDKSDE